MDRTERDEALQNELLALISIAESTVNDFDQTGCSADLGTISKLSIDSLKDAILCAKELYANI